jgi:hypothetical protein
VKSWFAKFNSPNVVAGSLFLLNVSLYFGIWYIYLFTYQPACNSIWEEAYGSFVYAISDENLYRSIFIWMLIAPVSCCVLAAAYFSRYAYSRNGALALFIASITLGLATLVFKGGPFVIFIAMPIFFGWRCFAQAKHCPSPAVEE